MKRAYARLECSNGTGTDTYSVIDAPRGRNQSNWYEMASSGSPSEGKVLMKAVEYKKLDVAQTNAQPVYLIFGVYDTSDTGKFEQIKVKVKVLGATPFVTSSNTDVDYDKDFKDSVEVSLAGYEWYEERTLTTAVNYNVQDGFSLNASNLPTFRSNAANSVKTGILAVLGDLGYSIGDPGSFLSPPVEVRNLHSIGRPQSETVGRACNGIGVIGDPVTKKLWNKGQKSSANLSLLTSSANRVVEKSFVKVSDDRFPAKVKACFTAVGFPVTEDIKKYEVTTPRGSDTNTREIQVGHWFAYVNEAGSVVNSSELTSIATWFVSGKGNCLDIQDDYGTYQFAGIIPFSVDGYVRRVLWTCNAHDVSTTISVNQSIAHRAREPEQEHRFTGHPLVMSRSIDGTSLVLSDAAISTPSQMDAIITGSIPIPGQTNRWRYAWTSATLVGDTWTKDSPPRASGTTTTDYATNKNESANNGTWVGPGTLVSSGSGYPAGFQLVAVGKDRNGNQYDYPVTMYRTQGGAYWFHVENDHDGTC